MLCNLIKSTATVSVLVLFGSVLVVFYNEFKEVKERNKLEALSEENKIVLTKENASINSFHIEFDQDEWDLLISKLNHTRYFKTLDEKYAKSNEYGFDPLYAEILVDHWKTKYDWQKHVDYLNKYPQFKLNVIDDVTIHYLRFKTNENLNNKPIKLLMMDGWPGHFFGFYKMIDYIATTYNTLSFDIIVPSIPGYGYSTPLTKPLDTVDTARYFDALMRFVHNDENCQYFIHGEDWGSVITLNMAKMYPNRVQGIHVTMPQIKMFSPVTMFYGILAQISPSLVLTEQEIATGFNFGILTQLLGLVKKSGYFHIQATKPDTLAHGLTDSPVGLLAYILEKYSLGSFGLAAIGTKDGMLENFNRDDLLTIVTYYWMTNSISSSMRFYKTYWNGIAKQMENYKVSEKVPVAVQYFKNEVTFNPSYLLKKFYLNLKSFKIENKGGHFASFENPVLSAEDFISFVSSLQKLKN